MNIYNQDAFEQAAVELCPKGETDFLQHVYRWFAGFVWSIVVRQK